MTVNEAIQLLQDLADDGHGEVQVVTEYNYGDYVNTRAVREPDQIEMLPVIRTGYSESGYKIFDETDTEGGYEEKPDARWIVIG